MFEGCNGVDGEKLGDRELRWFVWGDRSDVLY